MMWSKSLPAFIYTIKNSKLFPCFCSVAVRRHSWHLHRKTAKGHKSPLFFCSIWKWAKNHKNAWKDYQIYNNPHSMRYKITIKARLHNTWQPVTMTSSAALLSLLHHQARAQNVRVDRHTCTHTALVIFFSGARQPTEWPWTVWKPSASHLPPICGSLVTTRHSHSTLTAQEGPC